MCEQTEISYLDGDVVWVKLRSYWWPGQVVGLEKLPDDIQAEFQRKPLIAAVKFFQEDSFEFVKNYQQIYKYNCTQKEDFIRKGLDKYRIKSRDGSNYMDKFPEDVKTAEILTNGDPDIILSEKFSPEEKPDISGLFGEKKIPKKKRNRDEINRKNDDARRKITHPRFLQESDHEVRIRQQTTNVPSSSRSGSSYPCHVCGFTTTRVNVAICHLKNHILNNETADTIKTKVTNNTYSKSKQINSDSPKRKYVKKSVPGKSKNDTSESVKRKYVKQNDKPSKKKKSDPELKEKLLADWTGDSDEDESLGLEKQEYPGSLDESSINQSSIKGTDETTSFIDNSNKDNSESMDLLQESDKLLQETDSFAKFSTLKDVSSEEVKSNLEQSEIEKSNNLKSPKKGKDTFHFKKTGVEKPLSKEKNDKEKALLSRFDFHEDDIPEPSISPVRKGARGLGLKKEIIKEFEMQQALKNDEEKDLKSNPVNKSNEHTEIGEEIVKSETNIENDRRFEKNDEVCETQVEILEIFEVEKEDEKDIENDIFQSPNEKTNRGSIETATDEEEKIETDNKNVKKKNQQIEKLKIDSEKVAEIIGNAPTKKELFEKIEINEDEKLAQTDKEVINDNLLNIMEDDFSNSDISMNKKSIIEEKDKAVLPVTLTFDLQNNSDNYSSQDEDKTTASHDDLNSSGKKRRGRPRKNLVSAEEVLSDNEHLKFEDSHKTVCSMESDRKTSESDSDRSNSDKKRKSNKKSESPLYFQNFDNKLSKNDGTLSESDDKSVQEVKNKRKDRKIEKSNITKVENLKSPLFDSSIEFDFTAKIMQPELKESVKEQNNVDSQDITDQRNNDAAENNASFDNSNENDKSDIFADNANYLKEQKNIAGDEKLEEAQNSDVDKLSPKKCQIKKFEFYKTDHTNEVSSDNTYDPIITNKLTSTETIEKNETKEVKRGNQGHFENISVTTEKLESPCKVECTEQDAAEKLKSPCKVECTEQDAVEKLKSPCKVESIEHDAAEKLKSPCKVESIEHDAVERVKSPCKVECTKQDAAESSESLPIKGKSENNQYDELPQDEFDKPNVEGELVSASNNKIQILESNSDTSMKETLNSDQEPNIMNISMMDDFDNIEVVVADNNSLKLKSSEEISCNANNENATTSSDGKTIEKNNLLGTTEIPVTKSIENLKSLNESSSSASAVSTAEIKVTVPVKKREKPRIIENVALKEPMILKTKLMEKHSGKIGKHKLESDSLKLNELKSFPKAKIMKIESVGSTSKSKPLIASGNQNILTKKIIKAKDEADTVVSPVVDFRNEQVITTLTKNTSDVQSSEKCIQQSSQSLVDMELDINSMPFVLSEDVFTPESIAQMPVVISSVLPVSSAVATTSTTLITPMKQIVSTNQALGSPKEINEVALKKKSGTPAILKSKSKAKPTITSIERIVPPLSSAAYKTGLKAIKSPISGKKTPRKYVIVQTSGQQQAYSTHQKVAIPTSKSSGNAQIVQQGGKVVILSSSQSDQPGQKILPLNTISKALSSGKVQRIITTKHAHPSLTAVGSSNIISSKSLNASKSSDASPTASPKVVGQKILNQQQVITSKSVLTQIPGTIGKSTVLGTLPQSILTKEGILTPLNTATLGGKTIIASKTLVAKNFSPQSLNTSKNIITPITQSIAGKTIINSQGLVTKGPVLTPITGSQVKALAAKKGNKVPYQAVQHKVQMTTPKNQTIPVSSSSGRNAVNVRTSNVVLLQNSEMKTLASNKKIISKPSSQTVKKQTITSVLPASAALPVQQKGKLPSTSIEAKSVSHKSTAQTIKLQQKIISDKKDEENVELKSTVSSEVLTQNAKIEDQVNQTNAVMKSDKNVQKNLQKRISNVKSSTRISDSVPSAPDLKVPPLELSIHDKMPKREEIPEQIIPKEDVATSITQVAAAEVEKTEEPKVSAQTQIMALPTESSDGTQTYVLLTVDDQGRIIPLDNNTLVSLDGTSSFDGSKTLYIDSSSLNESGNMDNIVLQIDNGSLTNIQPVTSTEQTESAIIESLPSSEVGQSSNQDILAAALANTDFQHEVNVAEVAGSTTMTSLTQTSLINQTILQSTIIPPTEPISSPLVLETSLTLSQPIMTPLEVPSNVSIQSDLASVTSNMSGRGVSQNALYITMEESSLPISNTSMPEIEETEEKNVEETDLHGKKIPKSSEMDISYSASICESDYDKKEIVTPSLSMIDENFSANTGFDSTNASVVQDNLNKYVTKTSEELIEDLTGNDSLQESSEKSKVESVSNDKSCSEMQELTFESHREEVLKQNQEDECVSTEECATTEASENVESLEDRNEEKLTSCDVSRELCNSSLESIMEVESSQEVGIEEQKEQKDEKDQKGQITLKVESGDDVKEQANLCQTSEDCQSRSEAVQDIKINFEESEEAPSQSYEEFVSATSDIAEVPSQSVKSESSQEATEGTLSEEPPSQSYGDLKHIDAPSQSFSCEMLNEGKSSSMDDRNFPTQSFEVEKMENFEESMENDTERSEEGNIPSQSNEVGEGEGIGTSSAHCALNEDETASSSYVPETPENQERDQDQESAISTSSYEIPPCEELNIASSSVIPDTSVHSELSEHSNIHNNGVPEIPTSSYSLNSLNSLSSLNSLNNPDSSSTHIDAVPTSSYEDQIVLEQNVSTSYQVSLAQLEESSSQNYVTDSSEERNEPTSYYAHHQDVTESYYENVCKESSPRLEAEEAQPSYYGSNPSDETSEASQSYFNQEATPSYGEHEISPSYYDPRTEAEATQSFYSSAAAAAAAASSQSPFYQEAAHEQRLVQGGEATPTDYTDRYSVDYASVSSPLDRHDLVESSVPARSMDR